MVRLGDVCTFYSGTGFPNIYQGKADGKYPFYKVGDISRNVLSGNRELKICENYIDDDTVTKIKGTLLPPQTVVFAKIGEALRLNRRAITSHDCLVDNNAMGIKSDDSIIDSLYFYYFMCNVDLQNYCESTTVPSVRKTRIAEIEIPLPPLAEQRRIAAVLDKVSGLIAKRWEQLRKLDELVKARFVEMFGDPVSNPYNWEKVSLSELADIRIGPFGSLLHKEDYIEGGHPLVNPSHIIDRKIVIDEKLTVSHQKYVELEAYHLKAGDVVMGRRGEMGRCAVVSQEDLLCGTGSLLIRPKGKVTADYIQKIISFPSFKKMIEDMAVGQTMPNLNVPIVSAFQIIKPPVQVQENYYTFVTQVDKSKLTIRQSLDKLEVLKKALMQQYFG
jgi:type I restriction-modification system specificity subunit